MVGARMKLAKVLELGLFAFLGILFAVASAGAVNQEALMAPKPAKFLSEYGLFDDLRGQKPAAGVVAYDLIAPLFSDYAAKRRYIFVPQGKTITPADDRVLGFPVGTVLVKTFLFPASLASPKSDLRQLETRLLIHRDDGWVGFAYLWDDAKGDGVLKIAGKRIPVDFIDKSGAAKTISYKVPNVNECKGCHTLAGKLTPIGPKARNLNRPFAYQGGTRNQLDHWGQISWFAMQPVPENIAPLAALEDETASLEQRARSYLDVNCAHCHQAQGSASNSGLFLEYEQENRVAWGYRKRPVAAGRGSGGHLLDIDPGNPQQSILIFRMESLEPGVMMPEIGRNLVHDEAVAVLKAWISQMR